MKYLLFIVCFGIMGGVYCQSDNNKFESKNSLYVEFVGEATTPFSLHYDRIIKEYNTSFLSINMGFGYYPISDDTMESLIGIPLSFSWNLGTKRSHLELGCGLAFSSGFAQNTHDPLFSPNKSGKTIVKKSILGNIRLGYKYQNPGGGLFFKVGLTPFYELFEISGSDLKYSSYPIFGIGIGYSL